MARISHFTHDDSKAIFEKIGALHFNYFIVDKAGTFRE
jgi:hypothetical protein